MLTFKLKTGTHSAKVNGRFKLYKAGDDISFADLDAAKRFGLHRLDGAPELVKVAGAVDTDADAPGEGQDGQGDPAKGDDAPSGDKAPSEPASEPDDAKGEPEGEPEPKAEEPKAAAPAAWGASKPAPKRSTPAKK